MRMRQGAVIGNYDEMVQFREVFERLQADGVARDDIQLSAMQALIEFVIGRLTDDVAYSSQILSTVRTLIAQMLDDEIATLIAEILPQPTAYRANLRLVT